MYYLKISFGIILALSLSRFIPHPPNFTSLIALSFYVPALLGIKYLPILLVGYVFTDLIIGTHEVLFFTWGSVIFIGLIAKFFNNNILSRIFGSILGATIFFIVTNFGVWSTGYYPYTVDGLLLCYTLAIPFFTYNLISTFIFSGIFEGIYKIYILKLKPITKIN